MHDATIDATDADIVATDAGVDADASDGGITIDVAPPLPGTKTSEKGGIVTIAVRLHAQPAADVLVPVKSTNEYEGKTDVGALVFTTASWSVPQTITVTGIDDKKPGPDAAYSIIIGGAQVDLTNTDDDEVIDISQGIDHACVRFVDGRMKCWGFGGNGELGLGDKTSRGNKPGQMGDALPFVDLGVGRTAKQMGAGWSHTCALLDDDRVKCWGRNANGELGLGDTNTRGDDPNEMGDNLPAVDLGAVAKSITPGGAFNCAILLDDTVKCWGTNPHGVLGLGDVNTRGAHASEMGANLPRVNLGANRTAKAISANYQGACAILDDDTLKCWGGNAAGQLGQGDTSDRGDNPNEMGDSLAVVNLGAGRKVKRVAVGDAHACALLDDDTLKCWGGNSVGQLGLGDLLPRGGGPNQMGDNLPAIDLGGGRRAIAISCGYGLSCALLDDETVKCWGFNDQGQLGRGDTISRGGAANQMGGNLPVVDLGAGLKVKRLSALWWAAGAILSDLSVKSWGKNDSYLIPGGGQLGQGDINNRGDQPNEMGNNLLPIRFAGP